MKEILFATLKFVVFLLILPLIAAIFLAFQTQILSLPVNKEAWVLWGAGTYVALNLFVYNFENVYTFGNSMVEKIMPFFKSAGYIVPIYTVFFIILYLIAMLFGHAAQMQPYYLFALAFSISMHLVLTAHVIYEADSGPFKAHYLITFGAVLVVSLVIISLLLAWAIPEYSLIGFVKSLASETTHLYKFIYKTLLVD